MATTGCYRPGRAYSLVLVILIFAIIIVIVVVLHLGRDAAKQAVFETVDPCSEEQSVRGAVCGIAAAESDRPEPIDGQRAAAAMQKTDELARGMIERGDASAAEIAN